MKINVNVVFIIFITHGNVIFDILELAAFRKYSTDWGGPTELLDI